MNTLKIEIILKKQKFQPKWKLNDSEFSPVWTVSVPRLDRTAQILQYCLQKQRLGPLGKDGHFTCSTLKNLHLNTKNVQAK